MIEVRIYTSADGRDLIAEWLGKLHDLKAKTAIIRRIFRLEQGNFGDWEPCRDGVFELRIDVGLGYRVYYAHAGKTVVLLLCGGNKRTQDSDMDRTVTYWRDWQSRKG